MLRNSCLNFVINPLNNCFMLQKMNKELDVSDHGPINELPIVNAITQYFVHLHGVLQNLEGRMIESARMGSKKRDKKLEEMRDYTKNITEKLQNGMLVYIHILFLFYFYLL